MSQLILNKSILASAIKLVKGFLPRSAINPALGHLLLQTRGENLLVTAGDGYSFATCQRTLQSAQDDTDLLLDGVTLDRLLSSPADGVVITTEGNTCEIKLGRSKYKLGLQDPASYPRLLDLGELQPLCSAKQLKAAVDGITPFSIPSQQGSLSWTEGVYVNAADGTLDFVCGSGKAIGIYRVACDPALQVKALLAPNPLKAFVGSINADDDMVMVGNRGRSFVYGGMSVRIAVFDIAYPDYASLLDTERKGKLEIDGSDLAGALERLMVLFEIGITRKVTLSVDGDELKLAVVRAQKGAGEEYVAGLVATGDPKPFDVDVVNLHRIVKAAPAGNIVIECKYGSYRMLSMGDPSWATCFAGTVN